MLAALLAAPLAAEAQGQKKKDKAEEKDPAAETAPETATENAAPDEAKARFEELERRLAAAEAQAAESRAEVGELKERVAAAEETQVELSLASQADDLSAGTATQKLFQFWGFFDLTFSKYFYPEDSSYNIYISRSPTFLMTNINLYFGSQMTETLSALVETRLSWYPHGYDRDFEYEGIPGTAYEREDTSVMDPFNTQQYHQHGITIERVHLTWSPIDWFNVIAGRFLTPCGIWNIDHGSPVVMTIRVPYLQLREMVPLSQTGVQVFGRLFPAANLFFDYGVTVSNGRGPMDEVLDLDDNKGVGLRLRLDWQGDPVRIAAGGYGYYGKYTDTKKVVSLDLVESGPEAGSLDTSTSMPLRVNMVEVGAYDEVVASADLLVEAFGVSLQGEYVWKRVDYTMPVLRTQSEALFGGGLPGEQVFAPSHTGWGAYGLLGWELPLRDHLGPVRITPYFLFEVNRHDESLRYQNLMIFIGGLNVKPSPYVTLKAEFGYAEAELDYYGGALKNIALQMAVSF
jgi:hypothetical protein